MALQDLLSQVKQGNQNGAGQTKQASEQEIKEAEAAGEIIGMGFVDEINKMAQAAAKEDVGDEYTEGDGAGSAESPSSSDGTVDGKKAIENLKQKVRSQPDNDAGAGSAENSEDTAKNPPNQPDTNKEESMVNEADANKIAEALVRRLT